MVVMWLKIKNPPKAKVKNRRKIKKVAHVARDTGCIILIKFVRFQIRAHSVEVTEILIHTLILS